MILSPQAYDEACDLLELPRGTQLTVAQVYEAASLQVLNERRVQCQECQTGQPCKAHR